MRLVQRGSVVFKDGSSILLTETQYKELLEVLRKSYTNEMCNPNSQFNNLAPEEVR